MLAHLNDKDLATLWKEDETIGWIYQYYNDETERKKMRDESAAPRNSRELAVRNQFFTPRYVVEFLTDNTLGRIWYEMTRGDTRLKDHCHYLVRRPTEIFLGDPKLAHDRIFGKPEKDEYDSIPEAYQGILSNLPTGCGPESRLISIAIPPSEFQKITGEPYQPFGDDRLGRLIHDLVEVRENPDAGNLALVWAAISRFTLNDYGGGYSREPWEKLWRHFRQLAQRPPSENQSNEELLRQPIFIPHRPLKDPREIRMLDPACGSMHFGLYAFDLFEVIYDEAWEIAHGDDEARKSSPSFAPFLSFVVQYPDKASFLTDIPRLIIEHNLHGIDIDPRAAQIAGLSLWLRAQRAWQQQSLRQQDRPCIHRSNIVCAEPMPGEEAFLDEFIEAHLSATTEHKLLAQLVRHVFDAMKLAGEAGSLLEIEEEIPSVVKGAQEAWIKLAAKPRELFGTAELNRTMRPGTQQDLVGLDAVVSELATGHQPVTTDFWEKAEERIYAALQAYAEQAEQGAGYQRRLFADDAARGFAFIDLCRIRYDVVLMNPPFGEVSLAAREYLYESLPESSRDIFAAFVKLFVLRLSEGGRLGVLTNRMASFNEFLDSWREVVFMGKSSTLAVMADLGYGVLDAVVEAAAYVCAKEASGEALFVNCLQTIQKEEALVDSLQKLRAGVASETCIERNVQQFRSLPGSRFAYTYASSWLSLLNTEGGHELFAGKGGICTGDDFRFYRCFWEVDRNPGQPSLWRWLAKGGEYSRYRTNTHLVIDWKNEPFLLRTKNRERYGQPGVTYTYRTTSNLSARVLNEGVCFSQGGPGIIVTEREAAAFVLAYLNSFVATYCLEGMVGGGDFSVKGSAARNLEPRYLEHLPKVTLTQDDKRWFREQVSALLGILDSADDDEAHPLFCGIRISIHENLRTSAARQNSHVFTGLAKAYELLAGLEARVTTILRLKPQDVRAAYSDSGWPLPSGSDMTSIPIGMLRKVDAIPRDVPKLTLQPGQIEFRFQNKLSHYLHADVEQLAHKFRVGPRHICMTLADLCSTSLEGTQRLAQNALSYCLGCALGRWDVRCTTGEKAAPERLDPFAPLPVCPPGQLQGEQGLPITKEEAGRLKEEDRWNYLIEIPWEGILVDDPGHPFDLEAHVQQAFQIIWKDRWEAIEREACEILGVPTLRDYFRKPGRFFADHLKRYSKSRRQAPIYWPLSTASGSYTLWIYYHRLNEDLLYEAVNEYVNPKISETDRRIGQLEGDLASALGGQASVLRGKLEEAKGFRAELEEFKAELLRVAGLPYKANLNDGVLITASPLWKLFRLPKWRNDLQACWKKLEAGEYDWAHLAYAIWPDRVKEVCKRDRSIAIAHGLEELYKSDASASAKKPRRARKS